MVSFRDRWRAVFRRLVPTNCISVQDRQDPSRRAPVAVGGPSLHPAATSCGASWCVLSLRMVLRQNRCSNLAWRMCRPVVERPADAAISRASTTPVPDKSRSMSIDRPCCTVSVAVHARPGSARPYDGDQLEAAAPEHSPRTSPECPVDLCISRARDACFGHSAAESTSNPCLAHLLATPYWLARCIIVDTE